MSKVGELIRHRPAAAAATGIATVLVLLLAVGGGSGKGDDQGPGSLGDRLSVALSNVALRPGPAAEPAQSTTPPSPTGEAGPATASPGRRLHLIVTVQPGRQVELRRSPNGPLIAVLGDRTEFGSDRNFWVVRDRDGWLGVTSELLPNGRLGWIRDDRADLRVNTTAYRIDADISERELRLSRGKRVVERFPVTVGGPGSPTPAGRYAVTDGLTTRGALSYYYGCCVLALTGHQPNPPPDWIGGDRIAIHGTAGGIGGAASAGCLRASDADMIALFRRVPLGTPVRIRR